MAEEEPAGDLPAKGPLHWQDIQGQRPSYPPSYHLALFYQSVATPVAAALAALDQLMGNLEDQDIYDRATSLRRALVATHTHCGATMDAIHAAIAE